ncbi:probable tRNA(His) guanylyltransferase [Parasteatoda tepidariorum]|uniref:probable tRNA(His) guanylyltransferase n=1 Tax=Parasteatoda tepidariorum TaxID=114398 RepID=UPI00077F9693|nr:probable tRNA(His) guanylyltransferase [Parasteatoda tepidariorum]
MAKSAYEYVKEFESSDVITPNVWIVVRIDGKCFHKFADTHHFKKPNDLCCLDLMNKCASNVMQEIHDIILAYGQSDEYSFVFERNTRLYKRRLMKILTHVCSLFSVSFAVHWNDFFPDVRMKGLPSFDGRIVTYPTNKNLRDYLSWRQTDCHINNLYNTTFWNLVQLEGVSRKEAEERIRHTISSGKHEILFQLGVNYNNEPEQFRKGTLIVKEKINKKQVIVENSVNINTRLCLTFTDIIGDSFWEKNPYILSTD